MCCQKELSLRLCFGSDTRENNSRLLLDVRKNNSVLATFVISEGHTHSPISVFFFFFFF